MEKVRQDAWSHEDDLMLAETVLRHIREGGTQLKAFEEVGDRLNRTAAACGFRWNAEIRRKYDQAIEIAKKQRKERKRALANKLSHTNPNQLKETFDFEDEEIEEATYQIEITNKVEGSHKEEAKATTKNHSDITLDSVIHFLQEFKNKNSNSRIIQNENARLTRDNKQLIAENEKLTTQLKRMNERREMIQEDYQALIQIMDRARKMVSLDDNDHQPTPSFKLGNESLEQIAE